MKNSRKKLLINIIILGTVLIAIILYYTLKAIPEKDKLDMRGKTLLLGKKTKSDFLSIDIQYKDANAFIHKTRLSNISGTWVVTEPLQKTANQGVINEMLDDLLKITSETNYSPVTRTQISNYGILQPNDIFTFRYKDGSETTLINGNISKPETYYYTMNLDDTNTIYIVYAYKFSSAELTTSQLLEKQIFTDNISDITSFSIRALDGRTYAVKSVKKNDKTSWYMTSPQASAADTFAVKKRILNFYSLHILEFLKYDRSAQDIKVLGLDRPVLSITTSTPQSDMALYISAVTNVLGHFAYSPRIPGIFVIRQEDIDRTFQLDVQEFEPAKED